MIESIPVHFSSEYAQVSKRPAKFDESPAQTHKNAGSVYAGIVSHCKCLQNWRIHE